MQATLELQCKAASQEEAKPPEVPVIDPDEEMQNQTESQTEPEIAADVPNPEPDRKKVKLDGSGGEQRSG